jgi:cell division protein FtsQ
VLGAGVLEVSRISMRGNQRLSDGEVLALVEGLRGANIVTVNLDEWRERVLASPWVEDVRVRRVLPSTIEIEIDERQPIGVARLGDRLYLVDRRGVVIDEFGPTYGDLNLPIVDGLSGSPGRRTGEIDPVRAELAARVIESLGQRPDLAARISQIDVSDPHNAVVLLDGETVQLRLGESDFAERLQGYLDLAPALRERMPQIDYVDLRFGDRLYVKPVE